MQKEIKKPSELLDKNGNLLQKGFSKKHILKYDRTKIKACKLRIKEWDYYLIYNNKFGLALTIADNSYMGLNSISFLDFENKTQNTKTFMTFMPKGKTNLPITSSVGDVRSKTKKYDLYFLNSGTIRKLIFNIKDFEKDKDLVGDIELSNEPVESLNIATPFKKDKHFYYNQKIVGFCAQGKFKFGDKEFVFDKDDSVGILDWGRGVWEYDCTWYWSACAKNLKGKMFGFNLGYGFGDTSNATENMLFYDGKASKLDQVKFIIAKTGNGKEDFLKPWIFKSNDKRLEMTFNPILDRCSNTNALIISSDQHQVFGKFNGKAVLDDGTVLEVKDMLGFAEKVKNRW